jgi:hypothetical protein
MGWRQVESNLKAAGANELRFRQSLMRYRLPGQMPDDYNHIQVMFDETGHAIQTCFFPSDFASSDLIIALGAPDHFYLDAFSRRAVFSRSSTTTLAYRMRYHFIYVESGIVASGNVEINVNTGSRPGMPFDAKIDQMCTPGYEDEVAIAGLPTWQGFIHDIDDYTSVGPESFATIGAR